LKYHVDVHKTPGSATIWETAGLSNTQVNKICTRSSMYYNVYVLLKYLNTKCIIAVSLSKHGGTRNIYKAVIYKSQEEITGKGCMHRWRCHCNMFYKVGL
jgi:hypothetical protein